MANKQHAQFSDENGNIYYLENQTEDVLDPSGKPLSDGGDLSEASVTFTADSTRTLPKSGSRFKAFCGSVLKFLSDLKAVSFSGSYNDLSNKPSIPSGAAASQAVANNCTTTAAGSVLDARQGKVLMDKANQLSSELQNKATINGNVKFNNISVGNSDIALVYSNDDNVNFRYKEASGSQNWTSIRDIVSSINSLRTSFQDGIKQIAGKLTSLGIPTSNTASPDTISNNIQTLYTNRYNEGYNAGKNNPASSGTYKISFSGRMHPPGDGSNWINVSDAIYIRVTGSSVVIDTNYISLANGQVDLNVAKV